jgi:hypothetical protein
MNRDFLKVWKFACCFVICVEIGYLVLRKVRGQKVTGYMALK